MRYDYNWSWEEYITSVAHEHSGLKVISYDTLHDPFDNSVHIILHTDKGKVELRLENELMMGCKDFLDMKQAIHDRVIGQLPKREEC